MSKPSELAALKMQVFALEQEKCASCGHFLSAHTPRQSDPRACHAHIFKAGRTTSELCKCKGFADETNEQMELT